LTFVYVLFLLVHPYLCYKIGNTTLYRGCSYLSEGHKKGYMFVAFSLVIVSVSNVIFTAILLSLLKI
jgi:hypothetical protein